MQNYYRMLGIALTATDAEIQRAYQLQCARLRRVARADRAMKNRLADLEGGYSILMNPRRRAVYDLLLLQDPAAFEPLSLPEGEAFPRASRIGRSVNVALLACCLFLGLDWALPMHEYRNETVLSRFPVSVASPLSNPQMAYRVRTQHTTFRLPSNFRHRVRGGWRITVWKTPLLGVVQRVSSPAAPEGPGAFRPYDGTIYGTFAVLPILLGIVAAIGVWPRSSSTTALNTAAVSGLLALITVAVMLIF